MSEVRVFMSSTTFDSSPGGAPSMKDDAISMVEFILPLRAIKPKLHAALQQYFLHVACEVVRGAQRPLGHSASSHVSRPLRHATYLDEITEKCTKSSCLR